jgi:CRISPR-associated endonuclease/helicase Cas3
VTKVASGVERSRCRTSLRELLNKLELALQSKNSHAETAMNRLRREVQESVRQASEFKPGSFRLTVPTGGGKTLASLLFALRHAVRWDLERVFVVIPYTSIIDQTVKVYREILGEDAVLEHHSNLDPEEGGLANRLATENWDRPVVVTTSVQFLETLFADHKRRLRKLHRVAGSVVVFDEVQTLPLNLLGPTRMGLRQLWEKFGASVVYCTATQPLLIDRDEAREIGPEPSRLFAAAQGRVRVEWPASLEESVGWPALAGRIAAEPGERVLAIVNKRQDAIELATLLGEDCIHLSALMCAEHRRERLAEIQRRLQAGSRCMVVATQLVEAGVDLDFPVVYRAFAGFDSLAQAAGRCNREGRLAEGLLKVFVPDSAEPRYLRQCTGSSRTLWEQGRRDLFEPTVYADYFRDLTRGISGDTALVVSREKAFDFPEVAKRFVMIEEGGTEPVVAPWPGSEERIAAVHAGVTADTLRALQPYTVSLHKREVERLRDIGALEPLLPWQDDSRSWRICKGCETMVYDGRFGFGRASQLEEGRLNLIVD